MLDAGELPGLVQRMMGHETLQMIHEKYYSNIKNYQRDDGTEGSWRMFMMMLRMKRLRGKRK
jgi:hypothetical protein